MQSNRCGRQAVVALFASALISVPALADETASAEKKVDACNTGVRELDVPRPGWLLTWENDSIIGPYGTDEAYTEGIQIGYRFRSDAQPALLSRSMSAICRALLALSDKENDKLVGAASLFLGQHFFTPTNLHRAQLIPDDRAYAGWLYVGGRLEVAQRLKDSRVFNTGVFHTFEIQLGTVGPRAQGEWVQKRWHEIVPAPEPKGWDNQLPNEFGVQARYTARGMVADWPRNDPDKMRWHLQGTLDTDINVGTILLSGSVGTTWRFGWNMRDPVTSGLQPAFVPPSAAASKSEIEAEGAEVAPSAALAAQVRPATVDENLRGQRDTGTPCVRFLAIQECYVYVGITGHAVGFNAFLDGTLLHGGHSVDKEPFFYDLTWGARLGWSRMQLDYSAVRRSREFSPVPRMASNRAGRHGFGALNLRCFAPIGDEQHNVDLVCPGIFMTLLAAIASK
jgi:lipid A 3-O-deacylase